MLGDLRFALRLLRKNPGFASIAILVLALGIGANTAIFTIVNAALLRPLPYRDPARIYAMETTEIARGRNVSTVAPADYLAWVDRVQSFEQLAALDAEAYNFRNGENLFRQFGGQVTRDFFGLFGVAPRWGRDFMPSEFEAGAPRVCIVDYGFWQAQLQSDPNVVGRQIILDGEPHTVVGVMGESFEFPLRIDIYRPLKNDPDNMRIRRPFWFSFARLKPAVTYEQAAAEMDTIMRLLAADYPPTNQGRGVRLVPMRDRIAGSIRPALITFQVAVGLVLLIACANVGNLLIARSSRRRQEIAVRVALGASGSRLARQMMVESAVLALLGALTGLFAAAWSLDWLVSKVPVGLGVGDWIVQHNAVRIDWRAFAFTLVCAAVTAILFGLAPALEARTMHVTDVLKRGTRRLQGAMVVAEIALAMTLMTAAGILGESFLRYQKLDPGYNPQRLVHARIALSPSMYRTPGERSRFVEQIVDRAKSLAGITSAAMINGLPLSGIGAHFGFAIEGQPPPPPERAPEADVHIVTAGYFAALQTPLRRGRLFDMRDLENAPGVVVVSDALARAYFPGEDPVGKRIRVGAQGVPFPMEIIGVVGDIRYSALETDAAPMLYGFYRQAPWNRLELREIVVRTAVDPRTFMSALRKEVAAVNRDVPVYALGNMTRDLEASLDRPRFVTSVMSFFASVALALASLGLYGLLAYAVGRRSKEFGIRMALGADRSKLLNGVLREGVLLAVAGTAVGIAGSFGAAQFLRAQLAGIESPGIGTLAAVAAVLIGVAAAASYIPARRATLVDPMIALRHE
jgi:putative ABC transport system permease protein